MKYPVLFLALIATPALAKTDKPVAVCSEPVKPVLFLSPMGEPFRPGGDKDDPVKRWFDQADANHDGTLTIGEMMFDGDRFFAILDKDHNGELLPDEVHGYEQDVAPEIRLYQARPEPAPGAKSDRSDEDRSRPKRGKPGQPSGAAGAGRYSFLNIPNPVASADDDINRAVDRREFRGAAAERFRALDPEQAKVLTLARLPKTPAQITANAACLARVEQSTRKQRR